MWRHGYFIDTGYDLKVYGTIPQASGLSSSTALTTAAVLFIAHAAGVHLTPRVLAELSFEAEVAEFNESGGLMDHYAVSYGNIIHVQFNPELKITKLPSHNLSFIIGDSMEPKEYTVSAIAHLKSTILSGYEQLRKYYPEFKQYKTPIEEILPYLKHLSKDTARLVLTTLQNRDLTEKAKSLLSSDFSPKKFGELIYLHHKYLRDGMWRSTPKIERLIAASFKAGALGAKINGSGGGGTMMAYAPGKEEEVKKAIEKEGGHAYTVHVNSGARIDL